MNKDFLDELLLEWSYRVPTGIPNAKNAYHLYILRNVLEEMNIEPEIINEIILFLKTGKAVLHEDELSIKKGPIEGEPTEAGTRRFYYTDNTGELHLVTKSYAEKERFKPATKKDVDTKTPKKEIPDEKERAPIINIDFVKKKTEPWKSQLEKLDIPKDQKERGQETLDLFEKYAESDTDEQRAKILSYLAENHFIEFNTNEPTVTTKKVYTQPQTGLPYKLFGNSASIMTDMHRIAYKYNIEVPIRGDSQTRALAAKSGQANEAGIANFLDSSEENVQKYKDLLDQYTALGGDSSFLDRVNKTAADKIKNLLPKDAKIISAKAIGTEMGGKKEISRSDPTDILIEYTSNKKTYKLKISAKIYDNPNSITMKNSGMNIGKYYFNDPTFDKKIQEIMDKYDYRNETLTDEEINKRKAMIKTEWMEITGEKMLNLSKTEEGQNLLIKMWLEIHGCGAGVYTCVANKKTGDVEIHPPDYYCKPKPPIRVIKKEKSVTIEMNETKGDIVELVLKTEKASTPKILFNHKTAKPKEK